MSKHFVQFILLFIVVVLFALAGMAWVEIRDGATFVDPVEVVEPVVEQSLPTPEVLPPDSDVEAEEEALVSLWEIVPGMVVDYGSNAMPVYQDEERLVLAYENRATSLYEAPGDKARFLETTDGFTFSTLTSDESALYDYRPPALEMPDGSYRRFVYMPERGGVVAMTSADGVDFEEQEGLAYEVESDGERNPRYFGVSTMFVDSQGGVVLLYNVTNDSNHIVVNRAYAADGWNFELTHENVLGDSLPTDNYPDPHTFVDGDGTVWLVVMHRAFHEKAPPLERGGSIQLYKSVDDGGTFDYVGQVMAWDDFDEWDVYSLNDPKIFRMGDQLHIVCAAMIPDESTDSEEESFKWILVQATE